ncbi:serine hydrolase domain-containing protein [Flaviaesturariibacter amylovorans]|uniref:Beta-lactamase-related domain-containing protein n=1 Tax=Flaviaesturariibacter amylovorans TaxID=1084520 RepID=A0ABP8GZF6_9BACT
MKKSALLWLALMGCLPGFAQLHRDTAERRLREYFTALTALRQFNGNVLIADSNEVLLRASFNLAPGRDSLSVQPDSRFIIASVSKVFVKYAILLLEEEGRLRRSDKLARYIPDFPKGNRISIGHLMEHRSGLPRELAGHERFDSPSLRQVARLAAKEQLLFAPGTQTHYSNIGFSLLHYIIDRAAPGGYAAYIQRMLRRLGLPATGEYNGSKKVPHFAWGFDNQQGTITATPPKSIGRFETGNYYSTIDDLYAFSCQLPKGGLVRESRARSLFAGDSLLVQAGGRSGYRAYFYKNLNTGVTILFTCNYTDIPIQEMTADLVNLLAGKPYSVPAPIDRKEIALPDSILNRYTGVYVLEADEKQALTFTASDGALWVQDSAGSKERLKADSDTSFFEDPHSKDGYYYTWNATTSTYELTIVSTGIRLKTKKTGAK